MKKKISFVSCVGDVNDTHTIKYINTLTEVGYEVESIRTGISSHSNFKHYRLTDITSNFWPKGLSLLSLFSAIFQRARNAFQLSYYLFRTKPFVVVATEPDSWFIAIITKFILRHKVIADIREVYEDRIDGFPRFMRRIGLILVKTFMRFSSKYSDEIIHVSAERQKVYNYLHLKGEVIVYYPDLQDFSAVKDGSPEILEDFKVIHAGALREKYGAKQIIEAFYLLKETAPDIKLYVLGGIAGEISNKNLLGELIDGGSVIIIQQIPFEKVLEYLKVSKIGLNIVLPVDQSHYLAQPRKLYEYISMGLPFVAAKVPTIEKVTEEWKNGIVVDPYSPTEIANAIKFYYENEPLRSEASDNSLKAHIQKYNWEAQKKKFVNVFVRALNKK